MKQLSFRILLKLSLEIQERLLIQKLQLQEYVNERKKILKNIRKYLIERKI